MQPLEGLERRIVVPGEDRRPGQALDVVGVERTLRARPRQAVVGIAPGASLIGAPALCRWRSPRARILHDAAARRPCGRASFTSPSGGDAKVVLDAVLVGILEACLLPRAPRSLARSSSDSPRSAVGTRSDPRRCPPQRRTTRPRTMPCRSTSMRATTRNGRCVAPTTPMSARCRARTGCVRTAG